MEDKLNRIVRPSEEIVARLIEGELIIVPLVAGIGDVEDELYTLNETGQEIWARLDGRRSLAEIAANLAAEFDAPLVEIQADICGLIEELLRRRIVVEASG